MDDEIQYEGFFLSFLTESAGRLLRLIQPSALPLLKYLHFFHRDYVALSPALSVHNWGL